MEKETDDILLCSKCNCGIPYCFPHWKDGSLIYCVSCSFKLGFIDSEQYLKKSGICIGGHKAGVNPITSEIEVTTRKRFSWEYKQSDYRKTSEYEKWRRAVIERDGKCELCCTSKKLVAHHKIPISEDVSLVYDVDNGQTLCNSCHPKEHARMRKEKRYG